ncbi:hypothetical protein O5623_17310 [Escherichia coli]|nr:hypothetical protein [Escherichia coli]
MERDGKDPQMQVAEVAQQSGTLIARDMDSEQAASMARGWWLLLHLRRQRTGSVVGELPGYLLVWMKISALKSSSFEFLHPWYGNAG